jgi:hypothetical protein
MPKLKLYVLSTFRSPKLSKYRNGTSPHCFTNLDRKSPILPRVASSLFQGFLPTVSRSLSLETSETLNSEVPKKTGFPTHENLLFVFGDLISQGFWLTLRTFEPRNAEMVDDLNRSSRSTLTYLLKGIYPMLNSPATSLDPTVLAISGILLGEFSTVQISSSKISGSKLTLRLSSGTYPLHDG